MGRPIIVGYDPGTTAALAILDTGGNILYLKSKKEFKKKEILQTIVGLGKPIIVAGDRTPLPDNVEKLASSLGCRTFEPAEDISNLEKYNLIKEHLDIVKNDHQRDALASALKAYKYYFKLFRKTDKIVSYLGLSEYYDKILKSLVDEESENINEAVNKVLEEIRGQKEKIVEKKKTEIVAPDINEIKKLREIIKRQENDIKILQKYNETLKKRLENVDEKFREQKIRSENFDVKSDYSKRLMELEKQIDELKLSIDKLKTFRRLEENGLVPIIEVGQITGERLGRLNSSFDLSARVVSINSFLNINLLNNYNIKAAIVPSTPDRLIIESINFPIIPREEVKIEVVEGVSSVRKVEFEEKLKKAKKRGLIEWVNQHKKRKF
ncbi:MAG: DUF460 domain-containing protein [Candidatus Aenigmatarchaeota archaeon]